MIHNISIGTADAVKHIGDGVNINLFIDPWQLTFGELFLIG